MSFTRSEQDQLYDVYTYIMERLQLLIGREYFHNSMYFIGINHIHGRFAILPKSRAYHLNIFANGGRYRLGYGNRILEYIIDGTPMFAWMMNANYYNMNGANEYHVDAPIMFTNIMKVLDMILQLIDSIDILSTLRSHTSGTFKDIEAYVGTDIN